jgi:methylated-DNA-[protein]-cysteine S-methyltransferase
MRTPFNAETAERAAAGAVILRRATITTPLGDMLALAHGGALCALEFTGPKRQHRLEARLRRWFPQHTIEDGDAPAIVRARDWLARYFDGVSADIARVPIEMYGAPFERRVWDALRQIPPGGTCSYGSIAHALGSAGAARAVGMANGANPIAIIVPCHRVIGANGTLTGYGGGLDRKTWLLNHEARWRRDRLF